MHIPDGFLSLPVAGGTMAAAFAGLSVALKGIKKRFSDRLIPLMGVMAAFIFAAQMFNFPVAGGTSGHLMGGMLAAVVVGPLAATVILTVVLIVQCLVFADGGLTALGANILNMAIVGTWLGFGVYSVLKRLRLGDNVAIFFGSLISVVAASVACAIELGLSGLVPIKVVVPAMAGIHSLIGIGEGVITVLVVSFVKKVQPHLLEFRTAREAA